MKLRNVGLVAVAIAALAACKKTEAPAKSVTGSGTAVADPWNAPPPAKDPLPNPLFWKLEKDGKTSYVLGTIHRGVEPETRLPEVVWQTLAASPTFAMETDVSTAGKLDLERRDGKTLEDDLGPERWRKLEDAIGKGQAELLKRKKPMLVGTLLAMRSMPETAAMDGILHARAVQQGKKLVYLEPIEAQIRVLEKWIDARMLGEMLDDLAIHDQRSKQLLDAYLSGDGDRMLALTVSERELWKKHGRTDAEFDQSLNDLLYARNESWIAAIEQLHAEGGGFIAVGAAHTVGPRSVIDLLEKRGFTSTRIVP